ncbi:GNAT family N-acetyltransferase [Pseudoroseomonas cervicalis]|uniref:Acetyltransferase, GNAT family n=1 Tax=Pseudoroseomonas cervicalis ATCC 49957 TaxID=525371 RepID=D5RRN0_9PROT|nr:GNAT family protein [Pseudoroseomonas cervicalis]EFH10038.1 acetyltransferase, GNAT family [Pseudoroseomonas cervicalis ATCC 49957]
MSRLTLRPAQASDAAALIEANRESRALHAPWVEPFTDQAGFDAWFQRQLTGPHLGLVAIEVRTGGIAGVVNLSQIVGGAFQSAFLGYYGMARFARQGLMTEALRLAIAHAFGPLGLHRVEANIQPGNTASRALVQRLGFRLEGLSPRYLRIGGLWRDHERWALLADED